MAEEKQTEEQIDDDLNRDDVQALRALLLDSHSRGIMPVSVYCQADFDNEE